MTERKKRRRKYQKGRKADYRGASPEHVARALHRYGPDSSQVNSPLMYRWGFGPSLRRTVSVASVASSWFVALVGLVVLGSVLVPVSVSAQGGDDCYVGLVVQPGGSCTYPGTDVEFRVDSSGTRRILFASSERSATTVNGVEYTFVASRQSGGGWLIEEVGSAPSTEPPATGVTDPVYTDVMAGSTHEAAISALATDGVFVGTECGPARFCPKDAVERWVMAVWLVRILDGSDPEGVVGSRFADVDAAVWWAPFVERLADLGVTSGCAREPARFCPHGIVTRARMASFLTRAFDLPAAPAAGFVDVAPGVHAPNIDALASAGITAGCFTDPLRYCPKEHTNRAQMATFLHRAVTLSNRDGEGGITERAADRPEPEPRPLADFPRIRDTIAGRVGSPDKDRSLAEGGSVISETVSLPLAGEVNLYAVSTPDRQEFQRDLLQYLREGTSMMEGFVGSPWPSPDVIAVDVGFLGDHRAAGFHAGTHIVISDPLNLEAITLHELCHYYFWMPLEWLREGTCEFLAFYIVHHDAPDREAQLRDELSRLLLLPDNFYGSQEGLGKAFLLQLYVSLGEEMVGSSLGDLYDLAAAGHQVTAKDAFETFRANTPSSQRDEFRTIYSEFF